MSAVIGALRGDLTLRTAGFTAGLSQAERELNKARAQFRRFGREMKSLGRGMALSLSLPLAAFGAQTVTVAGDFQASMNRVGAVTVATGAELAGLRDVAKTMGATTQFSASQAAGALGFLGQAGFSARQAMSALPGTLELASAAQMDLASSADIVSNVLSGYGLSVTELSRVNDVLVKTFTSSNTDLRQLGEAMKYAGPIAASAGVKFEGSAAAIGLMGNAGIQASMAGTALRGSIGRILDPTREAAAAMKRLGLSFTDSQGKIKSLDQIVAQLAPHANDAGLFMTLFGQRAGPAMAALVSQGSEALVELRSELENSGGTAAEIANAQMQGLNGALARLRSAYQALQLAIADSGLLQWAEAMANNIAGLFSALSEVNPVILRFATIAGGVAVTLGPLVLAVGGVASALGALAPAALAIAAPMATVTASLGALAIAWGPITAAINLARENMILLTPVIGFAAQSFARVLLPPLIASTRHLGLLAIAAGKRAVAGLAAMTKSVRTLSGALRSLRSVVVSTGIGALIVGAGLVVQKLGEWSSAVGGILPLMKLLYQGAREVFEKLVATFAAAGLKITASLQGLNADFYSVLDGMLGSAGSIVNKMVGAFVGGYKAIAAAAGLLPQALERAAKQGVNAMLDAMQSGIAGIAKAISSLFERVNLPPLKAPDLSEWKFAVGEARDFSGEVRGAFEAAISQDWVGPMRSGLRRLADASREAAQSNRSAATVWDTLSRREITALAKMREALRKSRDEAGGLGDEASEIVELLDAAAGEVETLSDEFQGMGTTAARGLSKATDEAENLKSTLDSAFDGLLRGLASGDVRGAIRSLGSAATDSFSGMLRSAFSSGGGGLAHIGQGLKSSVLGVTGGLSSLFAGGGFASMGALLSSAMPLVGAVSALSGIVKSFSTRTTVGAGIDLGVTGGRIDGGTFERVRRTSFWGLIGRTKTERGAFAKEVADDLQGQVDGIRAAVREAYDRLGVGVSDAALDAVQVAIRRIDTRGLSPAQVQAKVDEVFGVFGDQLSRSIGGVDLAAAINLADVRGVLKPVGQAIVGQIVDASAHAMALSDVVGGVDRLGQGVGYLFANFYDDADRAAYAAKQVDGVFARLGLTLPGSVAEFRALAEAQNLATESGRQTYAALLDVAPQFKEVADQASAAAEASANRNRAVFGGRNRYELDASRFATEFEAKLYDEMRNRGRYDQALIDDQNAEMRRQTRILEQMLDTMDRGNRQSRFAAQVTG